jgi:hypothetical protein
MYWEASMDRSLPIPSIRLLQQLSKNIYSSFKVGLKEFVINSFDAGADSVNIRIDSANSQIIIRDNGSGMTKEEIYNFFLRAGATTKIDAVNINSRPTLGFKGIGIFSVFFFAKELIVKSKKVSTTTCKVDLDSLSATDLTESINTNECLSWIFDSGDLDVGTEIILNGVDNESFNHIWSDNSDIEDQILYRYFSEVLPVEYEDGINYKKYSQILSDENIQLKKWNFSVTMNGKKIFRKSPIGYFAERDLEDEMFIHEFQSEILEGTVGLKGVLIGGIKKIKNERFIGLLLRNNNVGIGTRNENLTDIRTRPHMLQWLSGEILLSGQINDFITTDRERLVEDSVLAEEMKAAVNKEVSPFLTKLQDEFEQAKAIKSKTKEIADSREFANTIKKFLESKDEKIDLKFEDLEDDQTISSITADNSVTINKNSKVYNLFSKWKDRELFYSFLSLMQKELNKNPGSDCQELFNGVLGQFQEFTNTKDSIETTENDLGF